MKLFTFDHLMEALGWTLLHSLWQSSLIAFCLYLILAFASKLSPNHKYILGVTALISATIFSTATFLDLYFYQQPVLESIKGNASEIQSLSALDYQMVYETEESLEAEAPSWQLSDLVSAVQSYLNQNIRWVVSAWMLGVVLFSIKFGGSLFYVNRLKKKNVAPLSPRWQKRLQEMASELEMRQEIKLLRSEIAKVPMMIGHLKPAILIPASMLSGLPEDQLEAVIAHELAHIYRRDYWINMLQSLLEIVFFFHPAVWWMSSLIREEREKCCDDLAVLLAGDSLTYAKALANVEEVRMRNAEMALAITGGKESLFQRIERILQPEKRSSNQTARLAASSLAIVMVLLLGTSGDSIAYRHSEVWNFYDHITMDYPYATQDTSIQIDEELDLDIIIEEDIEMDETIETVLDIEESVDVDLSDTIPEDLKAKIAYIHVHQDSIIAQAHRATVYAQQFSHGPALSLNYHSDSFPDFSAAFPDSFTNINSHIHDSFVALKSVRFDSLAKLAELSHLSPILARVDSTIAVLDLNSLQTDHFTYLQDTTIQKRLRELEEKMRKKEKEFNQLIQEKERMIQKLMEEKQIELRAHQELFERQMEEHERLQEEHMEIQEKAMEEEMKQQEKIMEEQERILEAQARVLEEHERMMEKEQELMEKSVLALDQELVNDGLVKKGERYSFKISDKQNNQSLYLNDKKLSDELFKKYKDWLKKGDQFDFTEGTTLSISRVAE